MDKIDIKKAKPTKAHRLAIAPGILGTYYAVNADGHCRYFDYDQAGAYAYAGVTPETDPRLAPAGAFRYVRSGAEEGNPRPGTRCIFVRR